MNYFVYLIYQAALRPDMAIITSVRRDRKYYVEITVSYGLVIRAVLGQDIK